MKRDRKGFESYIDSHPEADWQIDDNKDDEYRYYSNTARQIGRGISAINDKELQIRQLSMNPLTSREDRLGQIDKLREEIEAIAKSMLEELSTREKSYKNK